MAIGKNVEVERVKQAVMTYVEGVVDFEFEYTVVRDSCTVDGGYTC